MDGSTKFKYVLIAIHLLTLPSIFPVVLTWDLQPNSNSSTPPSFCVKIFSKQNFDGSYFQLQENGQVSNFPLFRNRIPGWEPNASISFQVTNGCSLSLATQPYLRGDVLEFDENKDRVEQDSIQSMACTCDQHCDCSEIILKSRECARAYLEKDCSHCNSYYTTMKQESNKRFLAQYSTSVSSLVLRQGCTLTLHDAEKTVVTDAVTEVWSRNITEYSCICDNSEPVVKRKTTLQAGTNGPHMIDIPKARGNINSLLKLSVNKDHPGLMAGLQSLRNRRSSHNAYILLLGLTGSGKSTTVNFLFDNPNITSVGGTASTTTDILEFRIPVPVPGLGMRNSELRIIDTPGIADTRGIAQDAQFLATLEEYFAKHEELKTKIPNVVLIFLNFNDNRFLGEGSTFVKMLKTVELFRDKIIDRKVSNVVLVLTHYMSESKAITRDPSDKLAKIRKVIQEHSTLPNPTILVLAENKPDEHGLPTLNGFYKLPNGEFYPQNLFSQIERVLAGAGDPIGNAIFQAAFQDAESFKILSKPFPLMRKTHMKVLKYLDTLAVLERPIDHTEISILLNAAYENIEPNLKHAYPETLNHLKRVCHVHKMYILEDIPKTTVEILKFFKEIHPNPVSYNLLQNAFNISIPIFKGNLLLGSGYDILNDRPLATTILDIQEYSPTEIGFQLPTIVDVTLINHIEPTFQILQNKRQYLQQRAPDLGLQEYEQDSNTFSGVMKPGFNTADQNELSALLEYHVFQASLRQNFRLHPQFLSDLSSLKALNQSDWDSVQSWNDFFQKYGTHIVVQSRGGGSIEIQVQNIGEDFLASTPEGFTQLSEGMGEIVQYLANSFIGKETKLNISSDLSYKIQMKGGDSNYRFTNLTLSASDNPVDKWKDSVQYEPVMLETYLNILPITEVFRTASRENPSLVSLSEQMELAARVLFKSSLTYIPPTHIRTIPNSRDRADGNGNPIGDFGAVQEFAEIFKTMHEESKKMQETYMNLLKESQEEAKREYERFQEDQLEKKRVQAEQDAVEREDRKFEAQLAIQREELAAQRASEERQFKMQIQLKREEMEEKRSAAQQQLQLQQQEIFMKFITAENQRISEERKNKKNSWDKVLDVVNAVTPFVNRMIGTRDLEQEEEPESQIEPELYESTE